MPKLTPPFYDLSRRSQPLVVAPGSPISHISFGSFEGVVLPRSPPRMMINNMVGDDEGIFVDPTNNEGGRDSLDMLQQKRAGATTSTGKVFQYQ
jgi:hypothetical protein